MEEEKAKEREQKRKRLEEQRKRQVFREKIGLVGGTVLIVLLILLALAAKGCKGKEQKAPEDTSLAFEVIEEPKKVTLVAAGDNLYHMPLVETGQGESGEWNYGSIYAQVKGVIQEADLAVVNQETIFVKDRNNVSGYPAFGTPTEVGDALVNLGFDVIQHASNHAYDKQA